jgi:hypothetical protein
MNNMAAGIAEIRIANISSRRNHLPGGEMRLTASIFGPILQSNRIGFKSLWSIKRGVLVATVKCEETWCTRIHELDEWHDIRFNLPAQAYPDDATATKAISKGGRRAASIACKHDGRQHFLPHFMI